MVVTFVSARVDSRVESVVVCDENAIETTKYLTDFHQRDSGLWQLRRRPLSVVFNHFDSIFSLTCSR